MTEQRKRHLEEKYSSTRTQKKEFTIGGAGGGRAQAMAMKGKPRDARSTVRRLFGYFARERRLVFLALACALVHSVSALAASYLLRPIMNRFIGGRDVRGLALGIGVMALVYAISIATQWLQQRIMLTASQRSLHRMRRDLFCKLQRLPVRYFDTHLSGDLMSRFTNDVDTVGTMLNTTLIHILSGVITLVGTVVLMLVTNVWLAMITIVMTPLLAWVSKTILSYSREPFSQRQRALGALNGFSEEMISGQKAVKVFGREAENEEEFDYLNRRLCQAHIRAQFRSSILGPVTHNLCNLTYAITACVGGILVVTRGFDIGGLTVSVNYTRKFNRPINEISTQINVVFSALAGAERVFEVLDAEEEAEEPIPADLPPIEGDVELREVCFGYVPGVPVLHDISLHAVRGQKVAFVGSTGAGKTTVTNLLSRFYELESGEILIDGVPIDRIPRSYLRSNIAMVLQDTHLFSGTVRENIRYGRPDATDEEVEAAARAVSAHEFIRHLSDGYDTQLDQDGINLSQGQRQLLNIARAAVSHAPILILDEATSSIDTRTERSIEEGMDALMHNRTTFLIAHRLSTVRKADLILVLEKGRVVERGSHEELIELGGRYADLYHELAELD